MNEETWEDLIARYSRDWRERQVVRERFVEGLPPRDIFARRPLQFESVAEVYRIIENFQARVRHGSGPAPLQIQ